MAASLRIPWKPALVLFCLAAGIYAAMAGSRPPAAVPETAPPGEFSAARALKYLERLAAKPHPCGTAAHDEVLAELLGMWRGLGFDPQLQTAVLADERWGATFRVTNVLVRMKGTESGPATMLVAHYDSVPSSYGAADAGSGVAAILETARALRTGPAPKHDLIFLITDAEEIGLVGARAFVEEHPWAAEVGLAINLEARGTRGPSIMFETSPGNARLIRDFARIAPRPDASSFGVTVYRRMPNSTDLSEFIPAGMQGLNFAFIEESRDYHTPMDSIAHLDPRSLQHHGSSALALARYFGEAGVPPKVAADAVYFNAPGIGLVVYSQRTARVAAILALLILAAAAVIASKKGFLKPRKLLLSGLFLILAAVLLPVAAVAYAKLVVWAHGHWLPPGEPGSNPFYAVSLMLLPLALYLVLFGLFRKKAGWQALAFVGTSLGALLTAFLAATLPGASYITGWASLLGAAALLGLFLFRGEAADSGGGAMIVAAHVLVTEAIATGIIAFIFVAMGLAPLGVGAAAIFLTLALLCIVPAIEVLTRKGTAAWTSLAVLAFVVCTIGGALTTRYTARHPRSAEMGYLMDADTGRADWVVRAAAQNAWTSLFMASPAPGFRTDIPWMDLAPLVGAAAPPLAIEPPAVEKLEESEDGDGRILRLRVRSPRHAAELDILAPDADLAGADLDGKPVPAQGPEGKGLRFRFFFPDKDGCELRLRLRGREPLTVTVLERTIGLPDIPGRVWPQPPPEIAPTRLWTVVRKSLSL